MGRALPLGTALFVAAAAWCGTPGAPASAAPGCAAGGGAAPPGSAVKQVDDLDGDGLADTLWIADVPASTGAVDRFVGVITASGARSAVQIHTGSPLPLQALAFDARNDGAHQIVVSYGRGANLYVFLDCRIQTVIDTAGAPFVFDLGNRRGTGTGVGCLNLGDGRRLVGLQALPHDDGWTVRRTEISLEGTVASIGPSDTVTGGSAQDPMVAAAQTISCGDLDIDQDGVHER